MQVKQFGTALQAGIWSRWRTGTIRAEARRLGYRPERAPGRSMQTADREGGGLWESG